LDRRLYDWLAEPDEQAFRRAFEAYFRLAFPALTRYLARLSCGDGADVEEMAQVALIRFFERIGRGRREAAQAIEEEVARLEPLDHGPLHRRQTEHWRADVGAFRERAIGFHPARCGAEDDQWLREIAAVRERIPALQDTGRLLIDGVRQRVGTPQPTAPEERSEFASRIASFVQELLSRTESGGGTTPTAIYCSTAHAIVERLPRLQIPANGYLFDTAASVYFDERRRRRRQALSLRAAPDPGRSGEDPTDADPGAELADLTGVAEPRTDVESVAGESSIERFEHEDVLARFHEHLCRPVEQLAARYARARASGRALAERRRWESASAKLSRTFAVLRLIGEGHGQEDTAERLGLTRNQVKYVIEQVQAEYEAFIEISGATPDASRAEP
jgi:DNA-directed RNA polymerase specialized sigma24 family protein